LRSFRVLRGVADLKGCFLGSLFYFWVFLAQGDSNIFLCFGAGVFGFFDTVVNSWIVWLAILGSFGEDCEINFTEIFR
jgi:hypothetical protein